MKSLVERLRTPETPDPIYQSLGNLCKEAAAEIERLKTANVAKDAALEQLMNELTMLRSNQ